MAIESVSRKSSVTTTPTSVRRKSKSYERTTTSWIASSGQTQQQQQSAEEKRRTLSYATSGGEESAGGGNPRGGAFPSSWRRQSSEANIASGVKTRTNEESSVTDADCGSIPTLIIIGERSQPLTQLQKLHD